MEVPSPVLSDADCMAFLQWALPRLHLRWPGFRKVRGRVRKRVRQRMQVLQLSNVDAYRQYLEHHADEWGELDALCRITISHFFRDRGVFDILGERVLPELAANVIACGRHDLRCWSAGCASGEEAYSLVILWECRLSTRFPGITLDVLGSDAVEQVLLRAERGCYNRSSLKDVPRDWAASFFEELAGEHCVRPHVKRHVTFRQQDIRTAPPDGPFDLVLCRNLVFTYFDDSLQRAVARGIAERMRPGAALVIGKHEQLPSGTACFETVDAHSRICRRRLTEVVGMAIGDAASMRCESSSDSCR